MNIEVYSDVVCPWCWIGERRLFKALPPASKVRWRAFQLDPSVQSGGTPLVEWLGSRYGGEANARRMFERVTSVARDEGLTMNFDRAVAAATFDAHRLIWKAGALGLDQRPVVEALHKAHFTDGLDVGSHEVLDRLALELELPIDLAGGEGVEEVRSELATARELGVTGVPMFVFEGKYAISGAQDPATFRDVIAEVQRRTGFVQLAPTGSGEYCGDDGC
ncbi:DsbA family oxidoreductase [Allorhizocola rhizosphaerae]|uniref:DsbA family oxidoreductase n=1 Tax=Allorhizocola rhizosphaerae TaxID=1872709 RepID=UPI000E3BEA5E|nr:DsbA family oxidoreductase [Allorhizocola rhizosphaerae]